MKKRAGLNRKLGSVVASRTLTEDGHPATRVEIILGAPRRLDTDWECPFSIHGLEDGSVQTIAGSDSFQALLLAVRAIRARLEETGRRFLWMPNDPGFGSGIPLDLPLGLGDGFERRAKRFIEREVKDWAAGLRERARRPRTKSLPRAKTTSSVPSSKVRARKPKRD
jgi:hypothetical protein